MESRQASRLMRPGRIRQLHESDTTLLRVRLTPQGELDVALHESVAEATETGSWLDVLQKVVPVELPTPAPTGPVNEQNEKARGAVYDLQAIFDRVNRRYFDGRIDCTIQWGRKHPVGKTNKRQIQFGSYHFEDRIIRIHPTLDDAEVPGFFVEYIVYHEMLHAEIGIRTGPDGRAILHGPDFKARERQFERYHEAEEWQNRNQSRFIGS